MKVVGLTGTIGAGKDIVKEFLVKRFNCYKVTLSDIIRREKRKKFDRKSLQEIGNELRKNYGSHILAKLAIDYLPRDKEMIIVDGIRNLGEIEFLRKSFGKDFVLIAIDAPPQLRFERLRKRASERDPKSWEEFVVMDERDQGLNEPEYGQQTRKCIEQADVLLVNDGQIEDFQRKINEAVEKILG